MIKIIEEAGEKELPNGKVIRIPPIGRCHCGQDIELGEFTNECICGKLYNWAGQELHPREEWEEEG